jgi:transposase
MLVHHTPLYRVERFFEGMDMPLLFDEDLKAENFNDDALGRALDRLAEIDGKQLLHTVACRAVSVDNMEIKTVHVDTTSRYVYGEYLYSPLTYLEKRA